MVREVSVAVGSVLTLTPAGISKGRRPGGGESTGDREPGLGARWHEGTANQGTLSCGWQILGKDGTLAH